MKTNIEQKILEELDKKGIPNLNFLFSNDVLEQSLSLLRKLLEEEKKDFEQKLKIKNSDIGFELFDEFSKLDYFWSLLNHLENVKSSEKIREVTQSFEPEYIDF
jgi:hypothetical protein